MNYSTITGMSQTEPPSHCSTMTSLLLHPKDMVTSEVDVDSLWNVKLKQTIHNMCTVKDTDRTQQIKDFLENDNLGS
jgi:hypothetical protein